MMDTDDNPVALKLLHAFGRLRRLNGRQIPIAGLTHGEIMVLSHIRRKAAEEACGMRVSEIGSFLKVAAPTITQQLNELETRGFVEKHSDPTDRRAVRIRLTPKGDAAVTAAWASFSASFRGLVAYLGEDDSNTLADLLGRAFLYFQESGDVTP
jgi:DNA-binding MarR family transcriptional regulator